MLFPIRASRPREALRKTTALLLGLCLCAVSALADHPGLSGHGGHGIVRSQALPHNGARRMALHAQGAGLLRPTITSHSNVRNTEEPVTASRSTAGGQGAGSEGHHTDSSIESVLAAVTATAEAAAQAAEAAMRAAQHASLLMAGSSADAAAAAASASALHGPHGSTASGGAELLLGQDAQAVKSTTTSSSTHSLTDAVHQLLLDEHPEVIQLQERWAQGRGGSDTAQLVGPNADLPSGVDPALYDDYLDGGSLYNTASYSYEYVPRSTHDYDPNDSLQKIMQVVQPAGSSAAASSSSSSGLTTPTATGAATADLNPEIVSYLDEHLGEHLDEHLGEHLVRGMAAEAAEAQALGASTTAASTAAAAGAAAAGAAASTGPGSTASAEQHPLPIWDDADVMMQSYGYSMYDDPYYYQYGYDEVLEEMRLEEELQREQRELDASSAAAAAAAATGAAAAASAAAGTAAGDAAAGEGAAAGGAWVGARSQSVEDRILADYVYEVDEQWEAAAVEAAARAEAAAAVEVAARVEVGAANRMPADGLADDYAWVYEREAAMAAILPGSAAAGTATATATVAASSSGSRRDDYAWMYDDIDGFFTDYGSEHITNTNSVATATTTAITAAAAGAGGAASAELSAKPFVHADDYSWLYKDYLSDPWVEEERHSLGAAVLRAASDDSAPYAAAAQAAAAAEASAAADAATAAALRERLEAERQELLAQYNRMFGGSSRATSSGATAGASANDVDAGGFVYTQEDSQAVLMAGDDGAGGAGAFLSQSVPQTLQVLGAAAREWLEPLSRSSGSSSGGSSLQQQEQVAASSRVAADDNRWGERYGVGEDWVFDVSDRWEGSHTEADAHASSIEAGSTGAAAAAGAGAAAAGSAGGATRAGQVAALLARAEQLLAEVQVAQQQLVQVQVERRGEAASTVLPLPHGHSAQGAAAAVLLGAEQQEQKQQQQQQQRVGPDTTPRTAAGSSTSSSTTTTMRSTRHLGVTWHVLVYINFMMAAAALAAIATIIARRLTTGGTAHRHSAGMGAAAAVRARGAWSLLSRAGKARSAPPTGSSAAFGGTPSGHSSDDSDIEDGGDIFQWLSPSPPASRHDDLMGNLHAPLLYTRPSSAAATACPPTPTACPPTPTAGHGTANGFVPPALVLPDARPSTPSGARSARSFTAACAPVLPPAAGQLSCVAASAHVGRPSHSFTSCHLTHAARALSAYAHDLEGSAHAAPASPSLRRRSVVHSPFAPPPPNTRAATSPAGSSGFTAGAGAPAAGAVAWSGSGFGSTGCDAVARWPAGAVGQGAQQQGYAAASPLPAGRAAGSQQQQGYRPTTLH